MEDLKDSKTQYMTFADVEKLANTVAKTGMWQTFRDPQQLLVLMMMAQVEGCHPLQAVLRYDVIKGKPAKKSDAMLADFQMRGGKVTWLEYTKDAVEGEFMSRGMSAPCKVRWTYQQAMEAGLASKDSWKAYPRQMLKARVISEGVRISDPGVVAGLYTPEEVADFELNTAAPQSVTVQVDAPTAVKSIDSPSSGDVLNAKEHAQKVRDLVITMSRAGIEGKEAVLTWIREHLGREVNSRKELTIEELDKLLRHLAEKEES